MKSFWCLLGLFDVSLWAALSLFWIPFRLCRVFVLVLCLFKASFNICRYFGSHCIPICNRINAINKWRDCYSKGSFVCKWPNIQFNRGSKDYFPDCNPILSSDNSSYMMPTYLSFAQRLLRNSPRYKKEPKTSRKEPNKASWGSTSHLKSPKDSAANFLMSDTTACPKRGHVHAQWVSAIMEACARLTQQKAAAFNTVVISVPYKGLTQKYTYSISNASRVVKINLTVIKCLVGFVLFSFLTTCNNQPAVWIKCVLFIYSTALK